MSDLEFVQRCVEGGRQSWEEFIRKYSRLIYSYIRSVFRLKGVSYLPSDTVNELFHEILVLLSKDDFRRLKTYKSINGCTLASWLRQVTIHHTLDYVRSAKPMLSLEEELDGLQIKDVIADTSESIKDSIDDKEKMIQLQECIEGLGNDDKYFLELFAYQELSLQQIKEALGVSRGTVDMRKSRIIQRLKECFKLKGYALDS
jgi:RNA polymerase sigma factor (sigma-70 family)